MRHFLDLSDAGGDAIAAMINDAQDRKGARADWPKGQADSDAIRQYVIQQAHRGQSLQATRQD